MNEMIDAVIAERVHTDVATTNHSARARFEAHWSLAARPWRGFGVLMAVFAGGGIVSHQAAQKIGGDVFQLAGLADGFNGFD